MNNNRIKKQQNSIVDNDEYFYRHPEMFRAKIDEDVKQSQNNDRK